MNLRRRKIAIGAACAALAVAGLAAVLASSLGDSDKPPTHAEYAEKADKVCSDVEAEQARLDKTIFKGIPYNQSPPDRLWSKYAKAIIPTYDQQLESLRKLTPPKGEEAKLQAYFKATQEAGDVWRKVAADPANTRLLTDSPAFDKADNAAREFGLVACGHAED
jgi:hypothetical protein